MRNRALLALICCLVLDCSRDSKRAASPCDVTPLADLIAQHPVLVLCGAADFVPEAVVIADSTLGNVWQIDQPSYLAEKTEPARMTAALAQVCAILNRMPPEARSRAVAGIASWVASYLAIQQGDNVSAEFFATAVMQVPEVRAAISQDVIDRAPDGRVGDTMASAEFVAMDYALTHILARMPEPERARVLEEVRAVAADLVKREN